MKLEMEFHGSYISDVKVGPNDIEIHFRHVVIVATPQSTALPKKEGISAVIRISQPKYKRLPKKGILSDGELYGIPGKALNGRVPVDFQSSRECELELTVENSEYTITGKAFEIQVDMATLPEVLRH